MDIETRLEELAHAYTAGQLSEADLARLQEEALRTLSPDSDRWPPATSSAEGAASPGILAVGKIIGPPTRQFRLMHELGGRKRLWLARRIDAEHEFRAIKIFLPAGYETGLADAARDGRAVRADGIGLRAYVTRVRARVELAMKLHHPAIARIYAWRQGDDGLPFAEMDYLGPQQGETLEQRLNAQGHLPWEAISKWLQHIAAALDYAHTEHRLAHQHLDADTVFITDQGTVRLLGFGLALEIREPRSVLFSTGAASREGAEGSAETVPDETAFRRDVFALALLTYRLLTGHTVYEAQGQPSGSIPRPEGLTDDAWQALRRGLAYPSELCPVNASELIDMLDAAQRSALSAPERRPLPKWLWGLAAALALTVGGGGYWFMAPRSPAPDVESLPPAETADTSPVPAETADGEPVEEGVTLQAAEREIDQRAFESASRINTVSAYQLYLQRCPQCGYGKDARTAIRHLETGKQIETLKAGFEALAAALDAGRGERGDEALARLETLATLTPNDPLIAAGRERLARGWMKIAVTSLNQSDPQEARKWLKKAEAAQPDLPELAALNQALTQAETAAQVRQTDTEAFAAARRIDTRRVYWDYLDRCAVGCNHRAEAEAAIARLAPANPVVRDRLNDDSQGPEMVVIPAGEFRMGSPPSETGRYGDEPIRMVRIEKPFAIGKYEVMFHEYERFAAATGKPLPDDHGWGRGRRPVINVDWKTATAYAEWLSQQTGQRYRLPTEAEWEYAARARTTTSRYWGDNPDEGCAYANAGDLDGKKVFVGWTVMQCHDGQVYTAPAGSYRSNEFGLYDMAGNALEWTCSIYDKDPTAPVQRCQEPGGDQELVVRGGSWSDEPRNVRSADRHRSRPEFRDYFLGFRLVREQP